MRTTRTRTRARLAPNSADARASIRDGALIETDDPVHGDRRNFYKSAVAGLFRPTSSLDADARRPFNMFLKHYLDIGTERTSILLSKLFQLGF